MSRLVAELVELVEGILVEGVLVKAREGGAGIGDAATVLESPIAGDFVRERLLLGGLVLNKWVGSKEQELCVEGEGVVSGVGQTLLWGLERVAV